MFPNSREVEDVDFDARMIGSGVVSDNFGS
jgi:hypothetical protein